MPAPAQTTTSMADIMRTRLELSRQQSAIQMEKEAATFHAAAAKQILATKPAVTAVSQEEFLQHMQGMQTTYRVAAGARSVTTRQYALPILFVHPALIPTIHAPLLAVRTAATPIVITVEGNKALSTSIVQFHNELGSWISEHSIAVAKHADGLSKSNDTAAFISQLNDLRAKAIGDANSRIDALYDRGIALGQTHQDQRAHIMASHNALGGLVSGLIGGLFGTHTAIEGILKGVAHTAAAIGQAAKSVVKTAEEWASHTATSVANTVKHVLSSIF